MNTTTRTRLPDTRPSRTFKITRDSRDAYVTIGFYEDGSIGEIFCKIAKHGTFTSTMTHLCCTFASMLLQHGESPEIVAEKFDKAGAADHLFYEIATAIRAANTS